MNRTLKLIIDILALVTLIVIFYGLFFGLIKGLIFLLRILLMFIFGWKTCEDFKERGSLDGRVIFYGISTLVIQPFFTFGLGKIFEILILLWIGFIIYDIMRDRKRLP